jgi:LysM repeat protein
MLRYRIRRGDILGKIARRYHTTISSLIKINHIRRVRSLKPGRTILIRPGIRRVHVRRLARRKHRQSRLARSKKRKKVRG